MGKYLKLCALIMGCGLAFGCAAKQNAADENMRVERFRRSYEAALDEDQAQASRQLLRKARSAIGTPYVRGGSSPGGFDCSGFVSWVSQPIPAGNVGRLGAQGFTTSAPGRAHPGPATLFSSREPMTRRESPTVASMWGTG